MCSTFFLRICEEIAKKTRYASIAFLFLSGLSYRFLYYILENKMLASVAQGIEQRFPKPLVACSIHAGGIGCLSELVLKKSLTY